MSRAQVGVALLLFALAGSCRCQEHIVPIDTGDGGLACAAGAPTCTSDLECGERSVCHKDRNTGMSCCVKVFRSCQTDRECCPGQLCTNDHRCVDKFDECVTPADCGDTADRVCEEWNDPMLGPSLRCSWGRCGPGGECPEGQTCFAHFCVVNPPCAGQCPAGTACVPQAAGGGRCHPYGDRCDLAPKPGYLVVFTDPDNVFDVCQLSKVACEYAELPPLPAVDLGRHPSVTLVPHGGGAMVVAQYDGFYGDLVLQDRDASGAVLETAWIDGVPGSGTLTGGPSGPRGGISDPGDDVGKYTAIAAGADGTIYVSYYDQTHGDLRFAERGADGTVATTHRVDGAGADLGLYTSLALDAEGKPAIAYFQRAGSDDPSVSCPAEPGAPRVLLTGLKLARATSAHPRSEADWAVETVTCAARPPPPCFGCETGSAQVCVQDLTAPSGTSCKEPSSGCPAACPTGQVCIAGDTCVPKGVPVELAGIPWGRGLFPSLAFKAGTPVIAFYDRNRGNLVVAERAGTGWTEVTLDGEDGTGDTGDVGHFPSLAIGENGDYLVAYHDFTRRGLRFWSGASLTPVASQRRPDPKSFVDTGVSAATADGPGWVGANASLAVGPAGTWLAYQNATAADLRLARRGADGSWALEREWTAGALGFFARAVPAADGVVVVHTKIHARLAGASRPVPDHALLVEIVKAP